MGNTRARGGGAPACAALPGRTSQPAPPPTPTGEAQRGPFLLSELYRLTYIGTAYNVAFARVGGQ
eukprot:6045655-Prymnesium_polylepis.1